MSNTCKYFLHELGKSSSLKNAITPRNKYALQFSVKHYLSTPRLGLAKVCFSVKS